MTEVNFGFLLNDRNQISDLLTTAFARRKQLCPFPLEPHELLYVQHPPDIARNLEALIAYNPKLLNWGNSAKLLVMDDNDYQHKINLIVKTNLPVATNFRIPREVYAYTQNSEVILCWNGPETSRLREWAWKATQIELENRWALKIVAWLVKKATTHQQVHRYIPELYSLLQNQEKATKAPSAHSGLRFVRLYGQLNETGSSRAHKIELPNVSVKDRSNLKSLIVHTLLIQPHNGTAKDTEFDQTWVEP